MYWLIMKLVDYEINCELVFISFSVDIELFLLLFVLLSIFNTMYNFNLK